MLSEKRFIETALEIKKKAPSSLWEGICSVLRASSFGESKSQVLGKLPAFVNPDLLFLIDTLLANHGQGLTWREIGLCFALSRKNRRKPEF